MKKKFIRVGKFYVYIVKCNDSTLYTGYTPDINRRIKLHNAGRGAKYTKQRRPVKLVWFKEYRYFKNAFMEEKRIKKLPRAKKQELVQSKKATQAKRRKKLLRIRKRQQTFRKN